MPAKDHTSDHFEDEYLKYFTPALGAHDGAPDVPFKKLGEEKASRIRTFVTYGVSSDDFYERAEGDSCQTGTRY